MAKKVVTATANTYYFQYPALATVVTVRSKGKDNAISIAWHMTVSREPPLYAISVAPPRHSHRMIIESGEFVVNFVPFEEYEMVAGVGGCSGANTDKVSVFGLKGKPGSKVSALVLDNAYAAYECRLVGRHTYGDHDVFVGQILAFRYEPSVFTPSGVVDVTKVHPNVYLGEDRYTRLVEEQPVLLSRGAAARAAIRNAKSQ
jgi:flavin reductase (DIM6/NTAB) family NADH-FMN oxidoreductase RutF